MSAGDYDGGNTTGFVSPAGDALEGVVDLVKEVLDLGRPAATRCGCWATRSASAASLKATS